MPKHIHWHEGQFLQPQHFQLLQRETGLALSQERTFAVSHPYGLLAASLSVDDLDDFQIHFTRLQAVMPSGLILDFPETATLPAINFRQAFQSHPDGFTAYLAVPVWASKRGNLLENPNEVGQRLKVLYSADDASIADENTGENDQIVQIRKYNGMILFQDEDQSDLELIPLLRIRRETTAEGAGRPRLDPYYVPPTLWIKGSTILNNLFSDLASQVSAVRSELEAHLGSSNFDIKTVQGGHRFEQFMRLRILNKFDARLNSLARVENLTPFQAYLEWRDLFAELVAMYPKENDFEIPHYDHDDPYPAFDTLNRKIRQYLEGTLAPQYRVIDFEPVDEQFYQAEIRAEDFQEGIGYFLAVESEATASALTSLIENSDLFKLVPMSYARRALRGAVLKEDRHPPVQLPAKAQRYFYRIDTSQNSGAWEQLMQEPIAIIELKSGKSDDHKISLYVLIPPQSD
jgi:type VI secretion system protein ImpJ